MTHEAAVQLGKLGGKASAKKRFKGMSKSEISNYMKRIRNKKVDSLQKPSVDGIMRTESRTLDLSKVARPIKDEADKALD